LTQPRYAASYTEVAGRIHLSESYVKRTYLANRAAPAAASSRAANWPEALANLRRTTDELLVTLERPGVDLSKPKNATALACARELDVLVGRLEEAGKASPRPDDTEAQIRALRDSGRASASSHRVLIQTSSSAVVKRRVGDVKAPAATGRSGGPTGRPSGA